MNQYNAFATEAAAAYGAINFGNSADWNEEENKTFQRMSRESEYTKELNERLSALQESISYQANCSTDSAEKCSQNSLCVLESGRCAVNTRERIQRIHDTAIERSTCDDDLAKAEREHADVSNTCVQLSEQECAKHEYCTFESNVCTFDASEWWGEQAAACLDQKRDAHQAMQDSLNRLSRAQDAVEAKVDTLIQNSGILSSIESWKASVDGVRQDVNAKSQERVRKELEAMNESINNCQAEWLKSCHYLAKDQCPGVSNTHCEWTEGGCTYRSDYAGVWNRLYSNRSDLEAIARSCPYDTSTMETPDFDSVFDAKSTL